MKKVISQNDLIKKVSELEDIQESVVRQILKSAEEIITDYLSSTTPSNSYSITPFTGINITSEFLNPSECFGFFEGTLSKEKIKVKCNVSRYYNDKVNDLIENAN